MPTFAALMKRGRAQMKGGKALTLAGGATCCCTPEKINLRDRCDTSGGAFGCISVSPESRTNHQRTIRQAIEAGVFQFKIGDRCYFIEPNFECSLPPVVVTVIEVDPEDFHPPFCPSCECCDILLGDTCRQIDTCCECGSEYGWEAGGVARLTKSYTPEWRAYRQRFGDQTLAPENTWYDLTYTLSMSQRRLCTDGGSTTACDALRFSVVGRVWSGSPQTGFRWIYKNDLFEGCDVPEIAVFKLDQCGQIVRLYESLYGLVELNFAPGRSLGDLVNQFGCSGLNEEHILQWWDIYSNWNFVESCEAGTIDHTRRRDFYFQDENHVDAIGNVENATLHISQLISNASPCNPGCNGVQGILDFLKGKQ